MNLKSNRAIQNNNRRSNFIFHARQHKIALGTKTCLMGIVNITDNSFSNDGLIKAKKISLSTIFKRIDQCISEGADIIDIGGETSKPGALPVHINEELDRVIPAITYAKKKHSIISIDTTKAEVAQEAIKAGASIINTIKGTQIDAKMLAVVKKYGAGLILMHMRGEPKNMQMNISFKNVIKEVKFELHKSLKKCSAFGLSLDRIIIDPGIGFGKTHEQSIAILNQLHEYQSLGAPILVGASRKSFIGKTLKKEVNDRLFGSLGALAMSIANGAHIVRVHDIVASKDVATMVDSILNAN